MQIMATPIATATNPNVSPFSTVIFSSRSFTGIMPSRPAKIRASAASEMHCQPSNPARLATSKVCTSNAAPKILIWGIAKRYPSAANIISNNPGRKNVHLGLNTKNNLSVRQPSRNVLKCGPCSLRPSGCSVMGTWLIVAPCSPLLMIISVANSIPGDRKSKRSYSVFLNPRMPQ